MLLDHLDVVMMSEGRIEGFSDLDGSLLQVFICGFPGSVGSALDGGKVWGTEVPKLGEGTLLSSLNFGLDFDGGGDGEKGFEHRK